VRCTGGHVITAWHLVMEDRRRLADSIDASERGCSIL
jgi:hypothetical protein